MTLNPDQLTRVAALEEARKLVKEVCDEISPIDLYTIASFILTGEDPWSSTTAISHLAGSKFVEPGVRVVTSTELFESGRICKHCNETIGTDHHGSWRHINTGVFYCDPTYGRETSATPL